MKAFICTTCGIQYAEAPKEPERCIICSEERQYVNPAGQSWTTLEEMENGDEYKNKIQREEAGLYSVHTLPHFAIGQVAYIVQGENFNVLWDCLTYLDASTIEHIKRLGGIDAIALSHPHYYATQVEWAEAFDAPIYIHEDDRQWIVRPSERIVFWSGEQLELAPGIRLHRLGGHFKGAAVLEWQEGCSQEGVLLPGDTFLVVPDPEWATFLYSYPNKIPLPAKTVERMAKQLKQLKFNRVYDAFHQMMPENAHLRVQKSAKRYIDAANGDLFDT
ncbi:MBL fold metallo-hydrolase [Planococcus sp. YIM B11945]|uniref:MBL fold metallo-hydrolase n=1 Tax=Planococcus sp. YIM B11945 TaxID=3435410 RepID=UPI003D7E0BE1